MNILKGVSLKLYSTMRLGGITDYATEVKTNAELEEATSWANERGLPIRVIGSGSNIIWQDEGFKGLLVVNKIKGFEKISENHLSVTYRIGAGENWDRIVGKTAKLGLYGIECLSLIPGTAGATPIQNVGAYGQDISQTLVELEAYDTKTGSFVPIANADCEFDYRFSRFKGKDNGRFLIVSITLTLKKNPPLSLWSHTLTEYLDSHKITKRDAVTIRDAIIAIRQAKLPDPLKIANCGSFFANPIITTKQLKKIRRRYKDIPSWEVGNNQHKLAAAWLIERAGYKGKDDPETGMSTWKNHALVLVNENARSTKDLLKFKKKITDIIEEMFGIILEQEPELLP